MKEETRWGDKRNEKKAGLGIRTFASLLFALSLKVAYFKEGLWGIHFQYFALYKRVTVSNLLFKKELCEWFARDSSKSLAKNEWFARKFYFHMFWQFFTFLCSRANRSCCSSLIGSFLKSDSERFAQVAHDKRAKGVICSFSWVNRSFAHKNEGIARKSDEQIPKPALF